MSSKPQHSTAPFRLSVHRSPARIVSENQDTIAMVYLTNPKTKHRDDEHMANARLFTAAPDLLAALEAMLAYDDDPPVEGTLGAEVYASARAAIVKAKGVQ